MYTHPVLRLVSSPPTASNSPDWARPSSSPCGSVIHLHLVRLLCFLPASPGKRHEGSARLVPTVFPMPMPWLLQAAIK